MKNLFKALANFQQEVPTIHKGTQGYGYSYSSLPQIFEVINPLLKKHGLGFTQLVGINEIKTIIFHVDSGEQLETITNIPQGVQLKGMNDFQVLGSSITYIRRYALSSILGLVTDKDTDAGGEQVKTIKQAVGKKIELKKDTTAWNNVVVKLQSGVIPISQVELVYELTEDLKNELLKIVKK
jgi:hypothetical protein